MSGGAARVGLTAGLLVLGTGIGQATLPTAAERRVQMQVAVSGASVACPDGPVTAGATTSASGGSGALRARALTGPAAPVDLPGAGAVAAGVPGTVLAARGAVAAGLAAEHVRRVDDGAVRGLVAVRCTAPTTSAWFVGGSTVVGDTAELVLVNAEDAPAVVDVRAWSAEGPVDPRPGRGIPVPPRTRLVVPLDRLAPDRGSLALHVTASRGRVAPYVRHGRSDGRTPQGLDWVGQAQPPSTVVVVPGLPAGPGRRSVVVTNPGPDDTTASLLLTTSDGQLDPVEVDVPAGTSVVREVSGELERTAASVTVTSRGGPLLAAAFLYDAQAGRVRELAWAPSAAPLAAPALLADVALSAPAEQTLVVSALDEDAELELVPLPVGGARPPAVQRLSVPAGTTTVLRLSTFADPGARVRLAVELRVLRGRPYAARYLRERGRTGPFTAVLPVVSSVPTVPRPDVRADPLAGS